jgi:lysophospholipase L1-like esterase
MFTHARRRPPTFAIILAVLLGLSLVPAAGRAGDAGASPAAAPASPFESEIRSFEAQDLRSPPPRRPIVFIGSSSIRIWTSLEQDFPRERVLNRGFGGSHISDAVGFVERIVVPYAPPLVVMYAGGNDIAAGKSPAVVAADFQAFAARVWSHLPRTQIAFISIAPSPARWTQADRVREANSLIAAACRSDPRLHYIDVFPRMLGADGQPRGDLFLDDRLHMNRKGYEVWIPLVRETIQAFLSHPPAAAQAGARPPAQGSTQ